MITRIGIKSSNKLETWAQSELNKDDTAFLAGIGASGVNALSINTPKDSGQTASSWRFELSKSNSVYDLRWYNDAYPNLGVNVAIMLQYGHGTGTGGWVPGRDYINPALKPLYSKVSDFYLR